VHHPVVGDELYGGLHRALSSAPNDDVRAAIETLSGQALHAARLGFSHPVTGEPLEFEAPLPDDMQRVIQLLDEET
jgi:23S rRNA pseudouridine1911/1915/1917 synthase